MGNNALASVARLVGCHPVHQKVDFHSGHMPELQTPSLMDDFQEATHQCFPPSLPSSISKNLKKKKGQPVDSDALTF